MLEAEEEDTQSRGDPDKKRTLKRTGSAGHYRRENSIERAPAAKSDIHGCKSRTSQGRVTPSLSHEGREDVRRKKVSRGKGRSGTSLDPSND